MVCGGPRCGEDKMRYWGKNIVIDGSWLEKEGVYLPNQAVIGLQAYKATIFEETVQGLLRQLQGSSRVGAAVIQMINASPRELRIIPHGILEMEDSAHIVTDGKEKQCLKQKCSA